MKLEKKYFLIPVLVLLIAVGIGIGFETKFFKRAYPGVTVLDINLEGKDEAEILALLKNKTDSSDKIVLTWGTNSWDISFRENGIDFDLETTTKNALGLGRSGNLKYDFSNKMSGLNGKIPIDLIYTVEENKLLAAIGSISAQINIPAREPEVIFDKKIGKVEVTPGENGHAVDEKQLVQNIKSHLKTASMPIIEVPILSLQPKLNDQQLESAKQRALSLVGKKLEINFPDENITWELPDEELMNWIEPSTSSGWKMNLIKDWAAELASTVDREPQNASFQFVSSGRVREFKPSKEGLVVNQEELVRHIVERLEDLNEKSNVEGIILMVSKTSPEIKNDEVNNLGIKELIGKGESWFSGSITNRIFNLQKATEILNGILIAPGETFSFNQAVGEISANTGYKQAYIIKEGKTILGDGGGVCQTSTTLFRAALAAGLPISERFAHAYRVSYYEEKYQPGFDATVFQPSPDFKFKNDTPAYILIQTRVDMTEKKLTYEIFGTNDGRKVEISKSRTWEVISPPPDLYIDDPTLPVGTVRQTEHAARGAKVAFDWKVTRGEEILQERTFYSNYAPWQAVYLRGTKI